MSLRITDTGDGMVRFEWHSLKCRPTASPVLSEDSIQLAWGSSHYRVDNSSRGAFLAGADIRAVSAILDDPSGSTVQ
jgi:hypothetical protein